MSYKDTALMKALLFLLAAAPALATTTIQSVSSTSRQTVICYSSDQTGPGVWKVSRGKSFSTNIPDIERNGGRDNRFGSYTDKTQTCFVIGTPASGLTLAADADYWYELIRGSDKITGTFHSASIPNGFGLPQLPMYTAANAWEHIAQPPVDWVNGGSWIDPATGAEWYDMTGLEHGFNRELGQSSGPKAFQLTPIVLAGNGCANAENAGADSGSKFAACQGTGNKIFIPFNLSDEGPPDHTLEDLLIDTFCGGGGKPELSLSLTADSGQTAEGTAATAACRGRIGHVRHMTPRDEPDPPFQGWGAGIHSLFIDSHGWGGVKALGSWNDSTVTITGTSMVLQSPPRGNSRFSPLWPIGGKIYVAGSAPTCANNYCTLAAYVNQTTVTIAENFAAPLVNAPWESAFFGVVAEPPSGMKFSLGYKAAYELNGVDWGDNGNVSRFSPGTVQVPAAPCYGNQAVNEMGQTVSCMGADHIMFSNSLTGYFWADAGAPKIYLFIPYNADGSVRAENREVSQMRKLPNDPGVHCNEDCGNVYDIGLGIPGAVWDPTVPGTRYAPFVHYSGLDNLWKISYDTSLRSSWGTKNSCALYLPYVAGPGGYAADRMEAPDCFDYTNLTPNAAGHDVMKQIKQGFQQGTNYKRQKVGVAHKTPSGEVWPFGVMAGGRCYFGCPDDPPKSLPPLQYIFGNADGICVAVAANSDSSADTFAVEALFGFDGVLKAIHDTWSGNWTGTMQHAYRWGSAHGACSGNTGARGHAMFTGFHIPFGGGWWAPNPADPLRGPYFSKLDAKCTGAWDGTTCGTWDTVNTGLPARETHTCSRNMPKELAAFAGTSNCVVFRLDGPFANMTPDTADSIFDNGTHNEVQAFPNPYAPLAATTSVLQNPQPMDTVYFCPPNRGAAPSSCDTGQESFVIANVAFDSQHKMTLELFRHPMANLQDPAIQAPCQDTPADFPAGQYLTVAAPGAWEATWDGFKNPICNTGAGEEVWNTADNTAHFAVSAYAASHTAITERDGKINSLTNGYAGVFKAANIMAATYGPTKNFTKEATAFDGSFGTSGGVLQQYPSVTQMAEAPEAQTVFGIDWKSINPADGVGKDFPQQEGNVWASTLRQYSVGPDTYAVPDGLTTGAASPPATRCANCDPKRTPEVVTSNMRVYKDVSSPNRPQSTAMADGSSCFAYRAGECVRGGVAGTEYVGSKTAELDARACIGNVIGPDNLCAYSMSPQVGQIIEVRLDRYDPIGVDGRSFGTGGMLPNTEYNFSNCTYSPDGGFLFCPRYMTEGFETHIWAMRKPHWSQDSANRTAFLPVKVSAMAPTGAAYVRARFGYQENYDNGTGQASMYHCTPRNEDCTTEGEPFAFAQTDMPVRQAIIPGSAATVTIPALPGRVLYYSLEWLDRGGSIIGSTPMQAQAVN